MSDDRERPTEDPWVEFLFSLADLGRPRRAEVAERPPLRAYYLAEDGTRKEIPLSPARHRDARAKLKRALTR
jgi:hypothetical protein